MNEIGPQLTAAPRILRLPSVRERTGLSRSSIYLRISQGRFPRPISLGERAVGWLESEITEWVNRRISASRQDLPQAEGKAP